jgi:PAS domain S-box-containing protein
MTTPTPIPAPVTVASPAERPAGVLLVDDRPENLLALEAILEPLGQRLVRANSGDEALKALLRGDYAVILLDVQMPGLNGFETAQLIKARERTRDIPIIFLTAISKEEEYVFKGYEVGAVDYMSKPFNPDILRSKVAVFVELWRRREQLTRQEQLLRDAQRRELELRHRAELAEEQARFSEVVSSAMDAIVIFDEKREIRLFNTAAERMFCRKADVTIGRPVEELFPAAGRDDAITALCAASGDQMEGDACATTGVTPRVHALTGLRETGEEFPLEVSVSCLTLHEGRSWTIIGRDITERQRAENSLRDQAETLRRNADELSSLNAELSSRQRELEQAMSARSRFYASMSHELRTPINAIIGYNTLLLDEIYGPLNEKQQHGIQRTHKAAKHLLELVNDVLDLSKIEAGKIELALQPVVFPTFVEDLFITVRPMADEHKTELGSRHQGDKITVVTDPRRVRQIVLNLLSNAIKFGNGKPIVVETAVTPGGGVNIAVIDQGQGIAPDDLQRIFDEFVQLEPTRQQGGTGLGLPISRRLAVLLGGTLTVESKPGEGSTFRLELPKTIDDRTRERETRPVREPLAQAPLPPPGAAPGPSSAAPPAAPQAPPPTPPSAPPSPAASSGAGSNGAPTGGAAAPSSSAATAATPATAGRGGR